MKLFKGIDLGVQLLLLLVLLQRFIDAPSGIFLLYFVLGGWQLFSMLLHGLSGWFMKRGGARDTFHHIVAGIGVLVLLSNWLPFFFFIWFFLLVGAPVLAVLYAMICWEELRRLKQRPLSVLR